MRKEVIAGLLVLLMLAAAGGYMIVNNNVSDTNAPNDGDDNNEIGDEWDVYYVDSENDLPPCGYAALGRLYYVASTAGFEVCTNVGWVFVDLTGPAGADGANGTRGLAGVNGTDGADGVQGPAGANGTDGANGVNGTDGANGVNGADGANGVNGTDGANGVNGYDGLDGSNGTNGTNGHNALVSTSYEAAGANCSEGGQRIDSGIDNDDDGSLSTSEIVDTQFVCNGADGVSSNGTNGVDGHNALVSVTNEAAGSNCADGGKKVQSGVDTNDDGSLSSNEVQSTDYVCNGADGTIGADGHNALAITATAPTSNCPDGGIMIQVGVDDNDDGALQVSEIDQTQYICNGADGANGSASSSTMLTSISTPTMATACDAGARTMEQGLDNGDGGGIAQNGILESGEVDYTTTYCGNYGLWMIKDINTGGNSYTRHLTDVNGTLYFRAYDSTNGLELWKSDGTISGTVMVKDINSGSGSSCWCGSLVAIGNTVYFAAEDGTHGVELWKSDGTASGTVMVKDIRPGTNNSMPNYLTAVGNTLFFSANDGTHGVELWKSDGTSSGTVMVKNIGWDPSNGYTSGSPSGFTVHGSTLFFSANDGFNGTELWKSDGTASGTVMVKDIAFGNSFPSHLTAVGNTLFFSANDGGNNQSMPNGTELWKSDGTANGTVMVKNINPTLPPSSLIHSSPSSLTAVGSTLFFSANDGTNGTELWKSDGTTNGTVMVKDIYSGSGSSSPNDLITIGGMLYFRANDGSTGFELWKSDGTASGTVLVKDIRLGMNSSLYYTPGSVLRATTAIGSKIYFSANDGINGTELWESDGTTSGTVLVKDINPGSASCSAEYLTAVGSTLYFVADDGSHSFELWNNKGVEIRVTFN